MTRGPLDLDLTRRSSGRVLAGVAGGLADRLGIPVGYVRAAFITTGVMWGLGGIVYVVLWLVTFDDVADRRPAMVSRNQALGLGLVFLGGLLAFRGLGWWPSDPLMLMVSTFAFGVALLSDYDWVARMFDPHGRRPSRLRVGAGVLLLLVGLSVLAAAVAEVPTLGSVTSAVLITVIGLGLAFGPWLVTMGRALGSERRERIRQEERAEMAAHLHDSVLQTLALMQRTDDPKRMTTLARQQERELRSWLYGAASAAEGDRLSAALEHVAARVEGDFTMPVEVVTVGEAYLDDAIRALVAASTEAIVNAAKHSGAAEVSVYAEVADGRADVWVADLGSGFDPETVPDDRRGLSDSIHGRMNRIGGGALLDTRPGEGTEVHLWAPLAERTEP